MHNALNKPSNYPNNRINRYQLKSKAWLILDPHSQGQQKCIALTHMSGSARHVLLTLRMRMRIEYELGLRQVESCKVNHIDYCEANVGEKKSVMFIWCEFRDEVTNCSSEAIMW